MNALREFLEPIFLSTAGLRSISFGLLAIACFYCSLRMPYFRQTLRWISIILLVFVVTTPLSFLFPDWIWLIRIAITPPILIAAGHAAYYLWCERPWRHNL